MADYRLAKYARSPFHVEPIMGGMAIILDENGQNAVWPPDPGAVFWPTVSLAEKICEQANRSENG